MNTQQNMYRLRKIKLKWTMMGELKCLLYFIQPILKIEKT